MRHLNPYLNFNGDALDAFNFYRSVFGGEFESLQYFKDLPGHYLDENEKGRVMHVSLRVGKDNLLMGCDTSEQFGNTVTFGTNFSLSISTESKLEADKLFKSLSAGARMVRKMQDEFWGSYFGMLTDKFGINWMISFENPVKK